MKKKFNVTVHITMWNTIEVEAENDEQAETIAGNWLGDDPYYYAKEDNGAHCEDYFVVEAREA